jgi:hypothetical protein
MSKLLGPSYVYVVLRITDYTHSQKVLVDAVFTTRPDAKEWATVRENKATSAWYKIVRRELR